MALRFIGIDPNTGGGGSPTVFLDEDERELVIQGWNLPPEKQAVLASTEWVAGHAIGIPEGEGVVRIPLRMIPILRKACDDAERAGLC
ncbi:hypothetical protein ACFC6L_10890 [Kitasatospora phosalacinea]|uniref:hypothetical protein n=1 Tax=Kitasatospora phosalacinea TaxID=2065 RepID=UPI0035DA10A3